MRPFIGAAFAAIALLACACTPPAVDASAAPVAVVEAIYAQGQSAYPGRVTAPLSPDLHALIDRATAGADGQVLDADPVMDANDPGEVENLAVTVTTPPADGRAVVTARFNQHGEATIVHYDMAEVDGAWLVDNIRSERGADMRAGLESSIAAVVAEPAAQP